MGGRNNIYRRFRTRYGFGVHSPWAYEIIISLIREKSAYYAYEELAKYSKNSPYSLPGYDEQTNRLLFRIVNYFSPSSILEVGTGSGVSAAYLSAARKSTKCVTIDMPHEKQREVRCFLDSFKNVESLYGDYLPLIDDFFHSNGCVEFAYVAHTGEFRQVMESLLPLVTADSMVVVGDVNSKDRACWWNRLIKDPRVGVTFEYKGTGFLFFDLNRYKQNYLL